MPSHDPATFIGESVTPGITPVGSIEPGHTYYWRMDTVFADRVLRGPVTSFHASTVGLAGTPYTTTTVEGAARHEQPQVLDLLEWAGELAGAARARALLAC